MKKIVYAACLLLLVLLNTAGEIHAREVKIAIFPFSVNSGEDLSFVQNGIAALLPSRITVPGSIAVIDRHTITKSLKKKITDYAPAEIQALALGLGADFFLTGSITKIGKNISIDGLLTDIVDDNRQTPVYLQSMGMDDIIPGLTDFAGTIKKEIQVGQVPADRPTAGTAAVAEPEPYTDDTATAYTEPEPDTISETPLEETERPRTNRYKRRKKTPPPPAFKGYKPLFAATPYMTTAVKDRPLQCLAVGDIDGDGQLELLASSLESVLIYKITGTSMSLSDTIKTDMDENIVSIDAADINGNGKDEIYVSSYEGHHANSFVIEHTGKEFKPIAENQKWFFRLYINDEEAKLIGQQTDLANPFSGQTFRFDWRKDELVSREEIILPGSMPIYGFTEGDIDEDGRKEYLSFYKGLFSSQYRLQMFSYTGRTEWRDPQNLGGSPKYFSRIMVGEDIEQQEYIPMRVICEDINYDGVLEVIVSRNAKKGKSIFDKLVDYNRGEVLCLHWDGADLVQNWTTGWLNDFVTDYILADIDGDEKAELVALSVADEDFFGKAINTISIYKQAR